MLKSEKNVSCGSSGFWTLLKYFGEMVKAIV